MYCFFVCFLNKHTLLFDQIIPVLTGLQTIGTKKEHFTNLATWSFLLSHKVSYVAVIHRLKCSQIKPSCSEMTARNNTLTNRI